jgi:hypothetical protein
MAKKQTAPADLTGQKEIEVLYLGIATIDGKHRDRWYFLGEYPEELLPTPVANDGRPLKERYDRKREWVFGKFAPPAGVRPGAIVKIKAIVKPEGGVTVWSTPAEVVGLWENEEDVTTWGAQLWHDRMVQRSQTEARRKATKQLHLESLDTFRAIYHRLPIMEQPLFLANVISYITRGTKITAEE